MTFGVKGTDELGPRRRLGKASLSSGAGEPPVGESVCGVPGAGVAAFETGLDPLVDSSSSSSTPNDSFPFAGSFLFFFAGSLGVEALYFVH
jgi:hypothetical protein